MPDKRILKKAFLVQPDWCDPEDPEAWVLTWGETAGKAKAAMRFVCDDDDENWFLARTRRSPENDLFEPQPDPCLESISDSQIRKLTHACGCSPEVRDPGYRNRYVADDDDGDLAALVKAGLMRGPVMVESCQWPYWFATPVGMAAALSTLPVTREGMKRCA